MDRRQLTPMYSWVQSYIEGFAAEDADVREHVALKRLHTEQVIGHSRALAQFLALSEQESLLAEVIALLHDIGRYRQYSLYHTFRDRDSVDHALLGLEELSGAAVLSCLTPREQQIVEFAVRNHNAVRIADTDDAVLRRQAQLIRDADKLDIYRVLQNQPIDTVGIPYGTEMAQAMRSGQQCSYRQIHTLTDLLAIRLLWIYDINFDWTLREICRRGYIEETLAALPDDEITKQGAAALQAYIARRLGAAYGKNI